MTRVVMVTLMMCNDDERMVSQEEAEQDVIDEVSEEVNSKDEVMHNEKNDW